jgi:outer membrane protein assembly factor BamB
MHPARALAQYHQVIVDYPDEPFESFEWNDWADNIAARAITALFASHPGRLYEEADRIIAESKVPAIKLVGYAAKVRSLGLQQRIAAMADTALSAMQKYPKEQRNFYLSTVDYSNNIAALVLNFYEAGANLDGFYRFAEQIQTRFGDYPVGAATALRHAIVADKTNADLQTVRRLYRRVQEEFSEFRFYDSIYREDLSTARARWRLSHFQEAGILQAEISTDNAAFRVGFEAQYPAILFLPAGRHAKILYSDENLKPYNEPSRYAKILLDDGQAGWVLKELLNPIREAVFENASDSHPAWSMALANSANNPVFAGPEIRQPKIVNVLENYAINGLRFFDVNGDQTLDLLLQQRYSRSTYGQGIVLAVAGRSHELLQSYGAGSLENFISYPDLVTGANKLFCKGYVRRPNSWGTGELRAYDLYSGALVWTAPQAFDDFSNLIYCNGRIYSVAADSLIQCFNSESGELQWTVSMGATVTGYRQRIQLAAHARALVAMAYDKSVFAFHPETGEQFWRSPARAFATTPVLDEEAVYLSSMRLTLTALRLADGAVKWERRLSSANSADFCLVTAQRVLYPSPEGILALDKYSGQTVWVNQSIAAGRSMIAAGNAIYLIGRFSGDESYSEYLLALREHDGKLLWRMPMNSYYSPLIYQSGRLFVQGETGVLVIADSASSRFADPGSPAFQLSQNYPNPFNGQTLISFELRAGENVQLTIYNVMGQRVRQLINGFHHPGRYTAIWDGTNEAGQKVGSGIYFYKLNVGQEAGTKRLLFLK